MNPSIADVAVWLASWLGSAALQTSVVVAALLLLERSGRLSKLRGGLVLLAMLKFAVPPWLAWPLPLAGVGALARGLAMPTLPPALAFGILAAWAGGSLIVLARLFGQRVRLARELDRSRPCDEKTAHAALRRAAEKLGVRETPRLLLSPEAVGPYTVGVRRPAIVLPVEWIEALAPEDLETVLLHETAHVRGRDPLRLELAAFLAVLWWWNPVYRWAHARWRASIEDACDDRVLDHAKSDPATYCGALLRAARLMTTRGASDTFAGALGLASNSMERRLLRLMAFRLPSSRGRAGLAVATLLVLAAITVPYVGRLAFPAGPARHAIVHAWKHGAAHPHSHP